MLTKGYPYFRTGVVRSLNILEGMVENTQSRVEAIKLVDRAIANALEGKPLSVDDSKALNTQVDPGNPYIRVGLPAEGWSVIRRAISNISEYKEDMIDHLHGIVLVSVWSSYEAYTQNLMMELFKKDPEKINQQKTYTYDQILRWKASVIDHIIEYEVDNFGRLGVNDSIKRIQQVLSFGFTDPEKNKLNEIYMIRNVFAHATGFIRPLQAIDFPHGVMKKASGELSIPDSVLRDYIHFIESLVDRIEVYVLKNIFQSRVEKTDPFYAYERLEAEFT